jgi:hypothetical protein
MFASQRPRTKRDAGSFSAFGRLVENDTHDVGGLYAAMFESQASAYLYVG